MKSKIVGGVLLAGAMALSAAGVAAADGPGDGDAPAPRPAPSAAQSAPALDRLPLSGNQLSPLGTLLGT
ncbi:hypothetical protein [Streptomyces sp. NPDC101115]|uniref:hypothetical protein n=1 Tax=Streptomyces sp. NPDC101115 TaxID=3366106 RepID=UPI003816B538